MGGNWRNRRFNAPLQRFVLRSDGMSFLVNGEETTLRASRYSDLLRCFASRPCFGEANALPFEEIFDFIWPGWQEEDRRYSDLKASVCEAVNHLRNNGLREAIRNHRGVGYYLSPDVEISMDRQTENINPSPLPTAQERIAASQEEKSHYSKRRTIKRMSEVLSGDYYGRWPLRGNDKDDKRFLALVDMGFRDAELARIYNVSRPTPANWRRILGR